MVSIFETLLVEGPVNISFHIGYLDKFLQFFLRGLSLFDRFQLIFLSFGDKYVSDFNILKMLRFGMNRRGHRVLALLLNHMRKDLTVLDDLFELSFLCVYFG